MTNEEIVERIQSGENTLIEALYSQNKGLIYSIARRFQALENVEDLQQEGYFGLVTAARLWDGSKGASFSTYATYWIQQTIIRYIENCGSVVRVPVHIHNVVRKYQKTRIEFYESLGRDPSDREIMALLGITDEQLDNLKKDAQMLNLRSLAEPIGDDGESTLEDFVQDDSGDEYEDLIEQLQHEQLSATLWAEVDALPEQQRDVIRDRYQNGHSLRQCAEALGHTPQFVKSLEDKAFRELRRPKRLKRLRPYLSDSAAYSQGLKFVSYTSFTQYGSSQEFAVIRMEEETNINLYYGKERII